MKKNLLLLLLTLLPFVASAADKIEIDDICYYLNSSDEAKTASVTSKSGGYSGDIVIPESVTYEEVTYSVTSIGDYAFYNCSGLTSVTIPNSVTSIGNTAFRNCSGLTSVTIPNSVTSIGDRAFSYCSGLTSITIPNSVTSIDGYAFSYCSGLTSITIPNSVTTIGEYAFYGCSGLTSITIPNSVTTIGEYAFYGCSGLTSVVIGSGVTSIAYNAFYDTNLIKTIWLTNTPPSGARYAAGAVNYVANDQYSFSNKVVYPFLSSYFDVDGIRYVPVSLSDKTCDAIDCLYDESARDIKLASTVTNKGVTLSVKNIMPYIGYGNKFIGSLAINTNGEIGEAAFSNCSALQTVVLNTNGEIGNYAFSNCPNINSVELGNNITSIGSYAFNGCASFEETKIRPAITEIGNSAFSDCTNLKKFIIEDSDVELKLGARIVESCQLDSVYIGRNINYPTSKSEGYSPFYSNTTLRAVKITDKETEISENEFYGCTNLQRVIIGDGVTSIGNRAFSGCSSLKFFTFGSEVKTIGQEAFSDCAAVTEITSRAIAPPTCGAQALDDINKWDCKLYVPKGYLASYQAAEQWKEFLFVEEGDYTIAKKYTLTYMVDGEEYKSYQIAEGSAITPEAAPTKDGYVFSGWSTIPATMPAEDVTITGTFTLLTDEDEITIKEIGKTTWCSEYDLDFTNVAGIKAYTATGYDDISKTIWLTRVMEVPAGTGFLVKGDPGTYKIPHSEVQSAYANWFVGNLGDAIKIEETDGDKVNYYLSGDGTFKSVNKTANIGTNKCYLQLPRTFEAAVTGATETVTVGSIGKASFAAPVDLDFTNVSGLKAFTATGYDKSTKTIWLTRVMKVQKGEGVLLKGDPNSYEIPSAAVQSSYENMFVGNTSGDEIQVQETSEDGSQTNYYLSGKDGSFVSVNGFAKIGNNKCYLALPTSMVAVSSTRSAEDDYKFEEPEVIKLPIEFKSIGSEGDGTTGVKEVKSGEAKGDEWYTLQGQRVAKPGKGLYIKNGKKVIVR